MLPVLNKERSLDSSPSKRRILGGKTLTTPLLILLVFFHADIITIIPVTAWSQTNFIQSGRRNAFTPAASKSWRRVSHTKLGKAPANRQSDFFEDPSISMENSTTAAKNLFTENMSLRDSIRQLEEENERLKKFAEQQHERELEAVAVAANNSDKRIILERFEGEHLFDSYKENQVTMSSVSSRSIAADEMEEEDLWCDVLDGDQCPVEPTVSFGEALRDRAYWLVGLLFMQSLSGIILSRNELLLANHPVIIYYLTMMVGAGGNAGNQASVRVIRGIALGTLNEQTRGQFLIRELKMAASLSFILSAAGFLRTILFRTPFPEAITVTTALSLIVFSSICLGAILPLILERIGIDPAHSSTTIQVIMDILGVSLAVLVSGLILDGPVGAFLLPKLGF
mmetsp:Transcript_4003/g.8614  ORF Transcript_4003/g.8614 Transcript_4003/m.8614 type:complete len:397 (-) Transcript_4003:1037-2227(-)|eukprot:CAMPEP_0168193708 /NCGR_PEP_ID=MMETSP0139_2-20121125/18758_1 /TAXON_ID=44445 /ORGANISM="Pseudo-nitzschia australis, Strain 10249 10 AB" /LENGTH=396 /DNA_ID=CAMNT_0008117097 /DNA_START=231 /DNA_END=1421 /DNA_ORIENTATION=+